MKRISDFESFDDFGFKPEKQQNEFVTCDDDGCTIEGGINYTNVPVEFGGSAGVFYSMEDILTGNSVVSLTTATGNTSAELSIDGSDMSQLAYLGSVYSVISASITKIKDTYPNGFLVVATTTGVTAVLFNNSDTYVYGRDPSSIDDYTNYKFIQRYNDAPDQEFEILTFITGRTYSTFTLDGQPSNGVGYDHAVAPKDKLLGEYYATLSQYEKDLLVPPYDRANYWPKDSAVPENIIMEGISFATFSTNELNAALLHDEYSSNFMWDKLYPHGQKLLDTEDGIAQKLVQTFAMSFDVIKRYQDHMLNAHSIGYDKYGNISNDLVGLLADQWNWCLVNDLNSTDLSDHINPIYENYVTGQSQQKLSEKDINFEKWRRILANITFLYKKKGTKEGLRYLTNLYGIPEDLLSIEELVNATNENGAENLYASPSNIVIPVGSQLKYISDDGSVQVLPYAHIQNTKFLNVNVDPFKAIEFEFYDWAWQSHPSVTDMNGNQITLSATSAPDQYEWVKSVEQALIKSDGWNRYDPRYFELENEGRLYYAEAATPFSLNTLEPFMDFLDDNWAIVSTKLIPASSKILSSGRIYRNALWNREKHQWNDSELDAKALPLNEDLILSGPVPSVIYKEKKEGFINVASVTSSKQVVASASIDVNSITSTSQAIMVDSIRFGSTSSVKSVSVSSTMDPLQTNTTMITQFSGNHTVSPVDDGDILAATSPLLSIPYGQPHGTLDYVDYSSASTIDSSANVVNLILSASNVSASGYTNVGVELFKKLPEDQINTEGSTVHSIIDTISEYSNGGTYKVSSLFGLAVGDDIIVTSNLTNDTQLVSIDSIDRGRNHIRTSPRIGTTVMPISNGYTIDWLEFTRTSIPLTLTTLHNGLGVSHVQLTDMCKWLLDNTNGTRTEDDRERYEQYLIDYTLGIDITIPDYVLNTIFPLSNVNIHGTLLLIEYVKQYDAVNYSDQVHQLVNTIATTQSKSEFKKVQYYFDWTSPEQTISVDNDGNAGDWDFNDLDISDVGDNTFSVSGTVGVGGLNSLNANVLVDKEEYFLRYKIKTTIPTGWTGDISGFESYSGTNLLESNYDTSVINGITYHGDYFTFFTTPKEPIIDVAPANLTSTTTETASIILKWRGVSDSDRQEIEYLANGTGATPDYFEYSGIPSTGWSTAIVVNVQSLENVDDNYVYSLQTTLDTDTYYWWRIKNFRSKLNLFGNNLEIFTTTEPSVFKTGDFTDGGSGEGEVPEDPSAPSSGGGSKIGNIEST